VNCHIWRFVSQPCTYISLKRCICRYSKSHSKRIIIIFKDIIYSVYLLNAALSVVIMRIKNCCEFQVGISGLQFLVICHSLRNTTCCQHGMELSKMALHIPIHKYVVYNSLPVLSSVVLNVLYTPLYAFRLTAAIIESCPHRNILHPVHIYAFFFRIALYILDTFGLCFLQSNHLPEIPVLICRLWYRIESKDISIPHAICNCISGTLKLISKHICCGSILFLVYFQNRCS